MLVVSVRGSPFSNVLVFSAHLRQRDGVRIGLVGCVKTKADHACPARDLYTSPLFAGRRRWVEENCDRWFVLSAAHGLVDLQQVLQPYDLAMGDLRRSAQRRWAERVLAELESSVGSLAAHTFELHAGADYLDHGLVAGLERAGAEVAVPVGGLRMGEQLAAYKAGPSAPRRGEENHRMAAVMDFHEMLEELADRLGGARRLGEVDGRSGWPTHGVYFFSEQGEVRETSGTRVVRIGTHALTRTSKTTLWSRLRAHRGGAHGGGNHRGSIFRLHVGTALLARGEHPEAAATWGQGGSAPADVRDVELGLERSVSEHIATMPFLWLAVPDRHQRAAVERGAIALLSNHARPAIDPPSPSWLGRRADRELIRSSHLWNVNHVTDPWSSSWLHDFHARIQEV